MWAIYENNNFDIEKLNDSFFGVTNDPLTAEKLVKDGYIVADMDTYESFKVSE